MMRMFWLCHPKAVTYTNYGLQFEIDKRKYHYDVYAADGLRDEAWALRNTGREFTVMYDPMDMTRVELWRNTATGAKYSATATPKVTVSRATQERTPEESSFMRKTIDRNKETRQASYLSASRESFLQKPLKKAMIKNMAKTPCRCTRMPSMKTM